MTQHLTLFVRSFVPCLVFVPFLLVRSFVGVCLLVVRIVLCFGRIFFFFRVCAGGVFGCIFCCLATKTYGITTCYDIMTTIQQQQKNRRSAFTDSSTVTPATFFGRRDRSTANHAITALTGEYSTGGAGFLAPLYYTGLLPPPCRLIFFVCVAPNLVPCHARH